MRTGRWLTVSRSLLRGEGGVSARRVSALGAGGVCSGGSAPGGCLFVRGVCFQGVCVCSQVGVCSQGGLFPGGVCSGGCLLPGGVCFRGCLFLGGVCSRGCLPQGVCSQGVSASRGCLLLGGCWYPSMHWGRHPPVNRITDMSKNITLATTSLRLVIKLNLVHKLV